MASSLGVVVAFLVLLAAVAQAQVLRRGGAGTGDGIGHRDYDHHRDLQVVAPPTITSLRLILAPSNREILTLQGDNQTIYLGDQPGSTFNIKAYVSNSTQSVRFAHNSNANYRTESSPPYAFCGNANETYVVCTVLGVGNHTVTATPYSVFGAAGTIGTARTVRFQIVTGTAPVAPAPIRAPTRAPIRAPTRAPTRAPVVAAPVTATGAAAVVLTLIHAPTDRELVNLTNGALIDVTKFVGVTPPYTFNIHAKRVQAGVNSVFFSNGQNENNLPWAYCGNFGPDFPPCDDLVLNTNLTVTANPFGGTSQTGTVFPPVTVRFRLVTPPPPPVTAPIPAPPTTAPPPSPTTTTNCTVPRLVGDWGGSTQYPLPVGESQGGIIGDDLLVISGFTNGIAQSTPECYAFNVKVAGSVWRKMDDLPIAVGLTHAAVAVVGTKLYMCGGFIGGHPGPHIANCFEYDHAIAPGSGRQWKTLPSLPIGRAGGSLQYVASRNALFFTGGAERPTLAEYVDFRNSWLYRLDAGLTGTWQPMQDMPFSANHMSYVTARDERGAARYFFLGGQLAENEGNGNIDTNYEWDAVRDVWTPRKKMLIPRGHASSSTLAISCGFIMVAGTTNGTGPTKEIHYYDIPSDTWTKIGESWFGVNTPVCGIGGGFLWCETGWSDARFSSRIRIEA